jgi:hypothetical protein
VAAFVQELFTSRGNFPDSSNRIGQKDRLWYDSESNTFRISDGSTPGGVVVGGSGGGGDYTLPTASTTVKGGVKVDGTTITINNQIISATQQDLSSYATQTYVTTRGYISSYTETDPVFLAHAANNVTNTKISNWDTAYGWGNHASAGYLTSVGTISYTDLSNKPTLFSGSYNDLTNKPTLVTSYTQLTDKPNLAGTYTFNVAADDSTLRIINSEETVKFVGAGGITTASDAEGTITITQGVAAAGTLTGSTLASGVTASSLTSVGTLTSLTVNSTSSTAVSITADGRPGSETNNWSFVSNQSIGGPRAWIQFPDSTLQTTAYTGNASTATKLATARAINGVDFDGSAAITITAAAGTLSGSTLASGVTASSLTSVGTLTGVTSNAVTAFTAGDAAISGVALQVPREGAIRNLYNGAANNMYFDVSIGGTSQGQFQFRSSSAFTNILTMSPTAFNVNTDAVVTARTPSFGRLPFNSAIDTELTIDDYRFRINTTTGNTYAQVISNVSGQTINSAWTAVAAISGQAVGQGGSTGTLVPNNAWTSLYTFASMNSAGDTVTVTLQDKQNSRIYRVTFMRSDNGSTAGYNIIAERLL